MDGYTLEISALDNGRFAIQRSFNNVIIDRYKIADLKATPRTRLDWQIAVTTLAKREPLHVTDFEVAEEIQKCINAALKDAATLCSLLPVLTQTKQEIIERENFLFLQAINDATRQISELSEEVRNLRPLPEQPCTP